MGLSCLRAVRLRHYKHAAWQLSQGRSIGQAIQVPGERSLISATDDNEIRVYPNGGEHYLFCRLPIVQLACCRASGARELPHSLVEHCLRLNSLIREGRCPCLGGVHSRGQVNDRNEMNCRTARCCDILGMNERVAAIRRSIKSQENPSVHQSPCFDIRFGTSTAPQWFLGCMDCRHFSCRADQEVNLHADQHLTNQKRSPVDADWPNEMARESYQSNDDRYTTCRLLHLAVLSMRTDNIFRLQGSQNGRTTQEAPWRRRTPTIATDAMPLPLENITKYAMGPRALTAPQLTLLLLAIIVCLGIALVWTLWEIEHNPNPRHDRHRSD